MEPDGQAAHGAFHFAQGDGVAGAHGVGGGADAQPFGDGAFNPGKLDAVGRDHGADDAG